MRPTGRGYKFSIKPEEELRAADGGNHFMFIEGHEKFNATVADFVG